MLPGKMEGIGYFTYETLKRMTRNHPEHRFIFLFDRPFDPAMIFGENVEGIVLAPQARHPLLWYLWFEFSVPAALRKYKPDLFLSPDGYISLRTQTKTLAVIHDINFVHYPDDLPLLTRSYYRYYFPRFAMNAARIATVSDFSKKDLEKTYGISPDKIDVIYNGASPGFKPMDAAGIALTREKFSRGKSYFLFVGALHQRKNIANLLRAYDAFRASKGSDVLMLLAGNRKWWTGEMEDAYKNMKYKDDVIFTGRLQDDELYRVMAAAFALTFVSSFEGFGIPILEAFNCDVPVITSNVSSMPEIAADAALLVDPFRVESISEGMIRLYKDENLRKKLTDQGRIRRQSFSWDQTSKSLWESIEKTISLH